VRCPLYRRVIDPCPRKVATGLRNECQDCIDDWHERAALIADGCRLTQPQAEAEATKQLRDAVAAAELGQRSLF
jgi:hypothetical protein